MDRCFAGVTKVQFSFIDPDTAQTVYVLDYILPDRDYGFAEKKLYWCIHPDACPLRGQQMNCETEIRKDSHGKRAYGAPVLIFVGIALQSIPAITSNVLV